jgi:hypothetical protein
MFNFLLKMFMEKGYCKGCIYKGTKKCKIIAQCVSRRRQRKDKGIARVKKEGQAGSGTAVAVK